MYEKYEFVDENGRNVENIAFMDIGSKLINANGEWECIGIVADVETTKTITIIDKLLHRDTSEKEERVYKRKYVLKRQKK